jgi:hypothetical protein
LTVLLTLLAAGAAAAQPAKPEVPALRSVSAAGVRSYMTESPGTLGFRLTNPTGADVTLRVLTSYTVDPDRQYGRDAWVPAHASLSSWFPVGAPPPRAPGRVSVELKSLLYEKKADGTHLLPEPGGQPYHEHLMRFQRHEPGTAVLLDAELDDGTWKPTPRDEARARDVRDLVRAFRECQGLSEYVGWVRERHLPPAPEAFDGVDHFIVASDRLADDVAGLQGLRGWVQRGGQLWVMLDLVGPRTVAGLLGDEPGPQVVDRVGLTDIPVRNAPGNATRNGDRGLEVEEPVEFVRVLLPPGRSALYTVHGWPAAFVAEVGRGKVLFTALGARGWMRPRRRNDARSPFPSFPDQPMARDPLWFVATALRAGANRPVFAEADVRPYLSEQIGYAVVGRGTALLVFGGLFLGLSAAAVVLGRHARREHLGWLGPALALAGVAAFVVLGERARSAVPPTLALAQVVDAAPGVAEVQLSGRLAVYQPAAADAAVGADRGGEFELDTGGLEGRVLRRVQTDLDRWHWENLPLTAGTRAGRFRYTARTGAPVAAWLRFGPDGADGRVTAGPFEPLEDALINTAGPRQLAVRVAADGAFRVGAADLLPAGQYVAGGLLTDRQRDRQRLYAKLFADPEAPFLAGRRLLLAWAGPLDPRFTLGPQSTLAGSALLALPVQFERTPPGTAVTVPGPFLDYVRVDENGRHMRPVTQSADAVDLRLRFQLPASVLPLRVERARLTFRLDAPGRAVTVSGYAGGTAVEVRRLDGPAGEYQIDIDDPRLLQPDALGGLALNLTIGAGPKPLDPGRVGWKLASVDLEVRGRTFGRTEDRGSRIED